jgi:hypothetical protein
MVVWRDGKTVWISPEEAERTLSGSPMHTQRGSS